MAPIGRNGRHSNGADAEHPEPSPQDLLLFEKRLLGHSIHTIAKDAGLPVKEVDAAIDRCCRPIDEPFRLQTICLELERLDRLTQVFYEKALDGDQTSAAIVIKVNERRSALLGLDVPSAVRRDPVMLQVEQAPQETSTKRLSRLLDEIVAERKDPFKPDDPD
jgi:hypothetical protein